jgi:hypothetical protein
MIGALQLLLFLGSIVPVAMWLYRASANARALGARGMEFTPGWTVGWFFIPVFNLFRPYQAVNELWRASARPSDRAWREEPRSLLVALWWAAAIVTAILSQLAGSFWGVTVDGTRWLLASDAVEALYTILALAVFLGLYRRLRGHAREDALDEHF